MKHILFDVITSWQVLGATIVLILYLYLVSHVARKYRRPRFVSKSRSRKKKAAATMASSTPEETTDSANTNEALGLREDD